MSRWPRRVCQVFHVQDTLENYLVRNLCYGLSCMCSTIQMIHKECACHIREREVVSLCCHHKFRYGNYFDGYLHSLVGHELNLGSNKASRHYSSTHRDSKYDSSWANKYLIASSDFKISPFSQWEWKHWTSLSIEFVVHMSTRHISVFIRLTPIEIYI